MAKFCGKCGARLDEATGHCPNCAPVIPPRPVQAAGQAVPPAAYPQKRTKQQKKAVKKAAKRAKRAQWSTGRKLRRGILLAVLILLAAALVTAAAIGALVCFDIVDIPAVSELFESLGWKQAPDAGEALTESYRSVQDELLALEADFTDADGYIEADEVAALLAAVSERCASLARDGVLTDYAYQEGDSCVYLQLDGWLDCLYSPNVKDTLSATSPEPVTIMTFEPFATELGTGISYVMNGLNGPDDAAQRIVDTFGDGCSFPWNYDNDEVSLAALDHMNRSGSIIIWSGHGSFNDRYGSVLSLGPPEKTGNQIIDDAISVRELFEDDSVCLIGDHFCVTPIYFEKHMPDGAMEGSLVYLDACRSLQDNRLVNSLLRKGARCVLGNTGTVWTPYGVAMTCDFFRRLTMQKSSGEYYSVSEALQYAKDEEGEVDPVHGSEVAGYYIEDFTLADMIPTQVQPEEPEEPAEESPAAEGRSEAELRSIAERSGTVFTLEYADYDGNGTSEAFAAIVGENDLLLKILFLAGDGQVTVMGEDFQAAAYPDDRSRVSFCGGKGFFWLDTGAFGSGFSTLLYSVKNGRPYALDLCRKIQGFYQDGDMFYTTDNEFLPEGGHLYPKYELVYDAGTQQFTKGRKLDSGELKEKEAEPAAENIFAELPSQFVFASGAGSWSTIMEIESDGSFTGNFHDADIGDRTVYNCDFSGKFSKPEKIDEYSYRMDLDSLSYPDPDGEGYTKDGTYYAPATPYGLDEAEELVIYLPGTPREQLPDGFLSWADIMCDVDTALPPGCYGIYNVKEEEAFIGQK